MAAEAKRRFGRERGLHNGGHARRTRSYGKSSLDLAGAQRAVHMDYFNDLGAHAVLEVVYNSAAGSLTDPRQVYVLRWIKTVRV